MTRQILSCIVVLFFSCTNIFAQQVYTIRGSVLDTLNNSELQYASVTLIREADSVLENFTRTDAQGNFNIAATTKGKYLLTITFPSFADYFDVVDIKNESQLDIGQIALVSRTHLLKEFVFTQQYAAIKIKGDTTEYMADSFRVRDNATVEALLKKLPGIQVDKNGQIVAQGEKVEKILVDGEEFFSDDPAVVTKSLQANTVDRVQVFDKKSDQAEFTGIDDGERTKTINLQLKEDKKRGVFGKAVVGGGAGDEQTYFENQGMVNAFKGKRKIAAFGIMANTGTVGLGWEDRDKFSGGSGTTEISDDGNVMTYFNSDDDFESWNGRYNGEGMPKAWTGGAHYSNKWLQDKHHFGSNYRYARQNIETTGNVLTQYVLPGDSQYFSQQNRDLFSSGERNRVDGLYEWKIDSLSTLKVTANANYSTTTSNSRYHTETFTGNDDGTKNILNVNDRNLANTAVTQSVNSSLDWRKKFAKKGRTISLNLSQNYKETVSDGSLLATNTSGLGNVDQRKDNNTNAFIISSKLSYTEPLSKKAFLELNYAFKTDNSSAERNAWNKQTPASDSYTSLDSLFSSNYAFNVVTNTGGANLRFVYDKVTFSFGGSASNAMFEQRDLMVDSLYEYNFTNFFPRANFTYKMSKQSKASFNYNGYTRQPTLQQIQPLRDNTDPLNIAIGNPNITQEFTHNFRLQANDYRALSGRYLWSSLSLNLVDNDISRTETIDAIGRRVYQYINIDGNYDLWGYLGYGFRIKKLDMRAGGNLRVNSTHVNSIVNGVRNTSDNNSYSLGMDLGYETKDEKFSVSLNPSVSYNDNTSTISSLATSYWTTETEFNISYEFPLKFEAGTDVNWYLRQQTAIFDRNNNVFRWNAYVSKKFMKNDQLELRAYVNDILNQNLGFNRYAQNNFVTEDNYNTIRRYGMLSLIWNFTKSAAGTPQQDAPIINIQK